MHDRLHWVEDAYTHPSLLEFLLVSQDLDLCNCNRIWTYNYLVRKQTLWSVRLNDWVLANLAFVGSNPVAVT